MQQDLLLLDLAHQGVVVELALAGALEDALHLRVPLVDAHEQERAVPGARQDRPRLEDALPAVALGSCKFLVKQLVELHKGHGPGLFKTLQKIMAVGLVIILLSGFWLGVSSEALRAPTLITTIAGLVIALATGLL